jgi:ATP/maltotriose-dependent transcriptional regulator MalT/DNA-binding SARP family transcriptional activator
MAEVDIDRVASSVEAVCAWLHGVLSEDLVLVLDDLHELQPDSDATRVVEKLCHRIPGQLHLVLISRRELPFSLQRLRGRGLVAEIHAPDLAFDIADVEVLLRMTVGAEPPGLSRKIWEHTEGWPAGVHSAMEMLRGVGIDERLATVRRSSYPGERFHDYLSEEIVGAAPECIRQALRRLAIFGEVTFTTEIDPGLDDGTTLLTELGRQGLVRRSGGGGGWTVVRPLRDFFEHELASSAGERKALHVTAANECSERGAPADALRHLLAAGDYAKCASLLIDHGDVMVERGQLDAVLQAAESPAESLDDPRVQQVLGQAQQVRGQWTQALKHFQRAGLNGDELEPALAWRAGLVAFARGEFSEVQALIRRTRWYREDTLDETRVLALAASAHRMTGNLVDLHKMASRTRVAARRCGEPRASSSADHVLALLAATEGDWRRADAYCTEALRNAEACDDLLQLTWTRACRAFHHFEAGAFRRACAEAEIALSLGQESGNPFIIAHALTTRGRARGRLGMLDAAAEDFAKAIDFFQHIGSRFLAWSLCGLGDLYRTRGQLVRTRAVYEEALVLAEPHHDVFGLSSALTGLARITAADDPKTASKFADRAVDLDEGLRKNPALLTRGWVELMDGDRQGASADANRVVGAARQQKDDPGLAEAITLGVLASSDPTADSALLREAIDIWQEAGCRLEEAVTRIVAARIGASIPGLQADLADQTLREHGVDLESRCAAGPLGVLFRSAPTVFIQTLGVFQVIHNGVPVPTAAWKSKKARDLLKILVARRRPTPRDQLMDLLWPEVSPAVASNRLSVLLSTVRDVLQPYPVGEGSLVSAGGVVWLNRAKVSVDVDEFLTQAAAALDAHRAEASDATARLTAAVTAHTGDFLEDDPYHEWALGLAEEVRATYIALLRALTARLRKAGDTDAVVQYTLRLLEEDPYDEDTYLILIKVLFDTGHLGQARRHYQHYVRRMAEINIPPKPLPSMQRTAIATDNKVLDDSPGH